MADVFHTNPADAHVHESGWALLPSGVEVMCLPLVDGRTGLFARLSYAEARTLASGLGAELLTMTVAREAWDTGFRLQPITLVNNASDAAQMRGRAFCERHDTRLLAQLEPWNRTAAVANAGKDWIAGASPGRARNGGWFRTDGTPIQPGGPGSEHHDEHYTDYSQLTRFLRRGATPPPPTEKPPRQTIRRGSTNRADVLAWQAILGIAVDGHFGPITEAATKPGQAARGLVADGIVGPVTWRAAGEVPA